MFTICRFNGEDVSCPTLQTAKEHQLVYPFVAHCMAQTELTFRTGGNYTAKLIRKWSDLKKSLTENESALPKDRFSYNGTTCPLPTTVKAENISKVQVQQQIAAVEAVIKEAPQVKKAEWLFVKTQLESAMNEFRDEGWGELLWRKATWG